MRYLLIVLGLFASFFGNAQSQGITNAQTKLRPNQLRWSPTGATNDSIYIIKANETTGEPAWYLVKLGGGSGSQDTTLAGDVVGGLNSTFVRKINGVTVENKTPQNREVLTYNGTQWTPDSIDLADLPQMNASRLLGRGSSTSGTPEQLTAGTGLRISTNILETHLTAGTGITLSGANPLQINNSLPDVTVSVSGGGINTVSGTYPNFTVTGTEVDGSITNEIQTIDTLTVASGLLRLKLSGSAVKTLATSNFTTSPAGNSMQVQYNNAGSFGALDSFTVSANPDNVGIGVLSPTARLDIQGSGSTSATNALRVRNSSGTNLLTVKNDGEATMTSVTPTLNLTSNTVDGNALIRIQEGASYGGYLKLTGSTNRMSIGYNVGGTDYDALSFLESASPVVVINNTLQVGSSSPTIISNSSINLTSSSSISHGSGVGLNFSPYGTTNAVTIRQNNGYLGVNVTNPLAGLHNAINTTASTPSMLLSGTGYSGGTSTTTKPTFLIEPTGTTSTGWSTSGTKLGVNAESGFTGNLIDLQLAASSKLKVDKDGKVTSTATSFNIATQTPSSASATGKAGDIAWDSNYIYVCVAINTWKRVAIATW